MTEDEMRELQSKIADLLRLGGIKVIDVPEFEAPENPGVVIEIDNDYDMWLEISPL